MPRLLVVLALAALPLLGCQHPTPEQCDRICWRYNELGFWERFDAEARNLAPEAREKLRAERQAAWESMKKREFDPGLDNCVKACRRGADPEAVPCMERAKTVAEGQLCLE